MQKFMESLQSAIRLDEKRYFVLLERIKLRLAEWSFLVRLSSLAFTGAENVTLTSFIIVMKKVLMERWKNRAIV